MSVGPERDDSISLYDLLRVPFKRWRLVVGSTTIGAGLIFSYALLTLHLPSSSPWNLLPNIYRSEAKVLLLDGQSSRTSTPPFGTNLLGSRMNTLPRIETLGRVKSIARLATELLTGRTIQDQIIDEFGFFTRYGLNDKARTRSRRLLTESFRFEFHEESSVMTISYEATDPEFAAAVLDRALELLYERFHAITQEPILRKQQHLKERLQMMAQARSAAQKRLEAFQVAYGIIDIGEQLQLTTQLNSTLKRRVFSNELELLFLREAYPGNDPAIVKLQSETGIVQRAVDELQTGFVDFAAVTIPQVELPQIFAQFGNLRQDLDIHTQTYEWLRRQYALTLNKETDPSHRFQIMESVEVPTEKHRPSRSRISRGGALIMFVLSVLLTFILEYWKNLVNDPKQASKLRAIRAHFAGMTNAVSLANHVDTPTVKG